MDETRQLLHAILKNQELTNAKVTAVQDELLHFRKETIEKFSQIDGRLDKMDSRMDKMDERFDRMDDRFDGMDKRMDEFNSELRGFKGETADNFRQIHERLDENAFEQRKERRHRESLERDLDKLTERLEKVEEHIGFERQ
ncbi:hypothetical protein [Paenibacillus mesotrionivorans]|uniref:Uncharacterized protein n=1 Tax=Paenibacillus mesotrionivorans TaxID=3160968 RepID=A0ACC7P8R4_9BACL